MKRIFAILFLFSLFLSATNLYAFQKKGIMHIGFGSYNITLDDATVNGSSSVIGYKYLFHPNYAWFGGLGFGSASGTWAATTGAAEYEVTESHSKAYGGFEVRANLMDGQEFEPFFGVGLQGQSYSYEFDYPGSSIGVASGSGVGPIAAVGIRMGIGKHFMIIPEFNYSSLSITTESGDSFTVVEQGLSLALVARF